MQQITKFSQNFILFIMYILPKFRFCFRKVLYLSPNFYYISFFQEDGNTFEGFQDAGVERSNICHKLAQAGYVNIIPHQNLKSLPPKHDKINGTVKRKAGRPPKIKIPCVTLSESPDKLTDDLFNDASSKPSNLGIPTLCSRSSRVIKPSRRFLERDDEEPLYSEDSDSDTNDLHEPDSSYPRSSRRRLQSPPDIALLGYPSEHIPATEFTEGGARVSRNISLYADSISCNTSQGLGRVTRRGGDGDGSGAVTATGISGSAVTASAKVQEKIEKILQSPWDGRVKQPVNSAPKVSLFIGNTY